MSAGAGTVRPEVAFIGDLACPWCHVGFRRFLALRGSMALRLRWHPFMVAPHLPPTGVPLERYLERRYGSLARAAGELRRIEAAGAADGARFAFWRIRRQPGTLAAHALLLAIDDEAATVAMAGRLFEAFFHEGSDIGDPAILRREAEDLGIAWPAALDPVPVRAAHETALALGVEGVPAFIAGGRTLIAGAQPVEVLRGLVEVACYPGRASPQGRQAS
ncbi:DsbA family protein [Geminicoccaceae bacterium 1502E]|nr:DsbA family protein [Geminicoccaceae bacterium 1502E]